MKKTHGAIVGVHTASATTEKRKWWILNPSPHRADFFFLKMVMLYIIGNPLKSETLLYKNHRLKMKLKGRTQVLRIRK